MKTYKALLLENIDDAAAVSLREAGIDVETQSGSLKGEELLAALEGIDVLGIRSKTQVSSEVFEKFPDLVAVGCFCIGTDQVDVIEAGRRGIAVFNSPFSNTRSVAELTIAEIVALHRRLHERSSDLHSGHWRKTAVGAHEVRGRTLGIVGYGHIGSQLSVLAEAFGMNVIYHDIAPRMSIGNAKSMNSLDAVLAKSDVLSLHVPDTHATRNLIGSRELALMPPGSMLINNARGTVVDLEALADALRSGHLSGAAVDVFQSEPKANDEPFQTPLCGIPNVILTPHIGGSTREAQRAIAEDTAEKIRRYINEGSTLTSKSVPQVDLPSRRPNQSRILHFHRNVPGVLSRLHAVLAELGVNINAEYLQSDPETSYVILDIDPGQDEAVKNGISSIEETIRMRTLF